MEDKKIVMSLKAFRLLLVACGAGLSALALVALRSGNYYGVAAAAFTMPVLAANYFAYRLYQRSLKSASAHVEETPAPEQNPPEEVSDFTPNPLHGALVLSETQASGLAEERTGLPHARFLRALFERERTVVAEHRLTLLLMDLNDFCRISDALGEERGGLLLQEVAREIRAQLRREDVLVRDGSDRFVALLRDTSPEVVGEIAVRVQACMASHYSAVPGAERVSLDVCVGQARLGADGATLDELLAAAEQRLGADKAAYRSFSQFAQSAQSVQSAQHGAMHRYNFIE